jgi:hypothetical protein
LERIAKKVCHVLALLVKQVIFRLCVIELLKHSFLMYTYVGLFAAKPRTVTGTGLNAEHWLRESQTIHEENAARLAAMSEAEILEEQQKLLATLGAV